MADLTLAARGPFEGLTLPFSAGACAVADATPGRAFAVMPFRGCEAACGAALGAALPGPGATAEVGGRWILWTGRGAWLVLGPEPEGLAGVAALVDQSDSFAGLALSGEGARAVLARLCPLDLHPARFADGATARSEIAHLAGQVTRRGEDFRILVARSFAQSLLHEVEAAMVSVAAQAG